MPLFLQFLTCPIFTCIKPLPLAVVDGLRRWRSVKKNEQQKDAAQCQNFKAELTPLTSLTHNFLPTLDWHCFDLFYSHLKSEWDAPECPRSNGKDEKRGGGELTTKPYYTEPLKKAENISSF